MDSSINDEETWSNEVCVEKAFQDFFPSAVKNLNVQKTIINNMFNFYLGGKKPNGLSVVDIVFAAISIMPLNENVEKSIWSDPHYQNAGTLFFLTPEDKLKHEFIERNIQESNDMIEENDQEINNKNDQEMRDDNYQEDKRDENDHFMNNKDPKNTLSNDQQVLSDDDDSKSYRNTENKMVNEKSKSNNVAPNKEKHSNSSESHSSNTSHNTKTSKGVSSNSSSHSNTSYYTHNSQHWNGRIPSLNGKDINWFGNPKKINSVKDEPIKYGPVENAAFTKYCINLLDQWDTSSKSRIILKYFFGIVGLTLTRGTTKSYMHLVSTFSGKKFRNYVNFMEKFCNPHKKCIKNSYRIFSRKEGSIRTMFAKIIVNAFNIDNLIRTKELIWNIFKITVVAHTADYGFNLVNMLKSILMKVGNYQIDSIIKATHCAETAESWQKLTLFLEKYMLTTSNQTTHHWARIINPENFKSLSCSNNYPLAVILGVFLGTLKNDTGIWKSAWVVNDDSNIDKYMKLGHEMYKKYVTLSTRTNISEKYVPPSNGSKQKNLSSSTLNDVEDLELNSFEDEEYDIHESYELGEDSWWNDEDISNDVEDDFLSDYF